MAARSFGQAAKRALPRTAFLQPPLSRPVILPSSSHVLRSRAGAAPVTFSRSFAADAQQGGSASSTAGKESEAKEQPTAAATTGPSAEEEVQEESALDMLKKELDEAEDKLKKEKHELLLALAEFENNKKKNLTERDGRRRNAMVNCARKMVEVYSEFDAMAHSEDKVDGLSDASKALQEGINLTRDLYRSTFERFDIVALQPEVGKPMNSNHHEKVEEVKSEGAAPHSIVEVVKPGWILEPDSQKPVVIKKAQVKVAA
eukprot:CAMPEP_0206444394 /NCGR_PEP_ID=MMETSP0324_2-20121206/14886_1 /ASSEMBLY_ACC=CAM_ASM_000836 /TAXON_ID=2866 /ORGANISM="Crypthecodinium cohnii, Strain Seligo" /LENGTH=258 /DNA_ID=CAMNT_0053912409 /DNA_START=295 /DNA_END=1071 /DNA_ORIENTATION=-